MEINMWRITGESESTLSKDGKVIFQAKTTTFEESTFSPDYFLPDEKIVEFIANYPGMGIFKKKILWILDIAYPKNKENYISSVKTALIHFSNELQNYACRITFSNKPLRVIAEGNEFSSEFREYLWKKYNNLFPWIKNIEESGARKDFENLFIEQLREQIKTSTYTFWVKIDSEIQPVYLLIEWNSIVMVTPSYCIPDYVVRNNVKSLES